MAVTSRHFILGLLAGFGAFLATIGLELPIGRGIALAALCAATSIAFPRFRRYQRLNTKLATVTREFPESVDLLCVCVEAGLGLQSAMDHVAVHLTGVLGAEWRQVIGEIRLGSSMTDALDGLAERNPTPELRHFVAAIKQTQQLGLPLAPLLRAQAAHARETRRLRISEEAHRIPIKVLFPLIVCLLPALLVVVIGPAGLTIVDQLGSG